MRSHYIEEKIYNRNQPSLVLQNKMILLDLLNKKDNIVVQQVSYKYHKTFVEMPFHILH